MASEVEPDIKDFLTKILKVVTALVVWSIVTMFFGLYLEWAHIHSFNLFNAIFYTWFAVSFTGLIYFFYRVWKK